MTTRLNQKLKLGNLQTILELGAHPDNDHTYIYCSDSSFGKKGEEITIDKLRKHIEPWLTALFQSEHLNLLIGAGLSTSIQMSATSKPPQGMGWINDLITFQNEINQFSNLAAKKAGRKDGNIEDQIRAINELIKGLEILTTLNTSPPPPLPPNFTPYLHLYGELLKLKDELTRCLKAFANSVSQGENLIRDAEADKKIETFNYLVSFLMSFASRTATRDRLHIFTTNYDRIIEVGAELAGLRLIDRFVGSISPVFRASRLEVDYHYNPPGIRGEPRYLEGVARFTKLHGSLDWIEHNGFIRRFGLPFGATTLQPFLEADSIGEDGYQKLMIYPNSVKDRETSEYPYVDLFRDLAAATCRPNSTLVTYGYSFGDEHINRVIEDMLTVPSTHLVIIAYGDPLSRINSFVNQSGRQAQITLLMGDHFGDLKILVDHYLPKPAIDKASIKMVDLLKQRGLLQTESKNESSQNVTRMGD
ncbi:SIR2 family protein [Acinetobacter pittii]|uniref:SIR2 family protein n=1 Tax=Acinetobacter pittii TaxID=48296 RepID=UPI00149076AD|nr:SIR2 family protein [Acinetobacter pittii]